MGPVEEIQALQEEAQSESSFPHRVKFLGPKINVRSVADVPVANITLSFNG